MTHDEAAQITRQAWRQVHGREPSELEVLYTQAVALLETGYGRVGQFGKLAAQGLFNWANIEKRRVGDDCPPGWAPGVDQGNVCFRVYPSDLEAAEGLVKTLTTRHWPTLQAMAGGSPEDMARAMRVRPAYYEGPPGSEEEKVTAYANAIRGAIKRINSNAPLPGPDHVPSPPGGVHGGAPPTSGAWIVGSIAVGAAVIFALKKGILR